MPSVIYRYMNLSAVLVLLCTALTVSLIALCYADLASRFTGSGDAWLYSYHAFGRFTGYELGIFTWFLGCCTLSAEIVALLTTMKSFLPVFDNRLVYYAAAFGLIILFAVINFFVHGANYSPVIPAAALTGAGPFLKHFGAAFTPIFYLFTGFSFLPIAAKQMKNPEKNIPRVLVAVMVSVTILDALMMLVAIGISGHHLAGYSTPLANAFGTAIGKWGYSLIIVGMLVSIFGVAFSASFNTPSPVASLANEHGMLPKAFGKKNKHDAPWVGILLTAALSIAFSTQSYLFLVSYTVLASFIQYGPSILAVVKFTHSNEYPTHGFKLPGRYLIPAFALLVSCYMVTNFTAETLLLGTFVALLAAAAYFFIQRDEEADKRHAQFLAALKQGKRKVTDLYFMAGHDTITMVNNSLE